MKKLSIIVAAYNVENYIKECIDSVLNLQIFGEYEIIVINDGSTDNTLNEIKKIKKELIRVISIENSGISNVRNLGITVAQGEYLFFMDGDDFINKVDFEFLINNLYDDYDIVIGGYNTYNLKETKEITKFFNGQDTGTGTEIIEKYFYSEFETAIWRAFYKKDNIVANNIYFTPNISIAEDAEWLLRLMILSKNVYFDNSKKIYNYRLRQGSVMTTFFSDKKYNDMLAVAYSLKQFMMNKDDTIQQMFKLNYYILVIIVSSSLKKTGLINRDELILIKRILGLIEFKQLKFKLIVYLMKKNVRLMLLLLKLLYR